MGTGDLRETGGTSQTTGGRVRWIHQRVRPRLFGSRLRPWRVVPMGSEEGARGGRACRGREGSFVIQRVINLA